MRSQLLWWTLGCLLAASMIRAESFDQKVDYYSGDDLLAQYVDTALASNPGLHEAWSRYRASLQRIPQVTVLPDPMLTYTQAIRSVETRVGPQANSFMLSQRFPWFGRLDLQGQVAFQEALAQYHAFKAMQRKLVADLKEVYYDLAYLDRALAITDQEEAILDQFERLAQARYSTGQGIQQGIIKIQSELARLLNRVQVLRQQRGTLASRLNTLMSRPAATPVAPIALPEIPSFEVPDREELYRQAERNRHELKVLMTRIQKNEQSIEVARRDFWPSFTLGAGFINVGTRDDLPGRINPPPDNGKNAYNVSVGINLPIWRDKYSAGVLEATENLIAEKQSYRRTREEIEFSVQDQLVRLESLQERLKLFSQVLIPQNEEALRSTEAAYQTGLVGVLDLLDSERVLLELRLMRVRLLSDVMVVLARLEWAIGAPFPAAGKES